MKEKSMLPRKLAGLAGLAGAALATTAAGAEAPSTPAIPETVEVMILGSYHFSNPGQDVANMDVDDVLVPQRQAELDALAKALAVWKPDRVLIERQRPGPDFLVEEYELYRDGGGRDDRSERSQIGFRLAALLGHDAVYGFDERGGDGGPDYFPFGRVVETAGRTGQADFIDSFMTDIEAEVAGMSAAQKRETIPASLLGHNDLAKARDSHSRHYYGLLTVGEAEDQSGAELNAMWYMRNAKMFGKLDLIAEPGERLLVVVGSGHLYWLHHLVEATPGYEYVSPTPYLIAADATLASD